MSKLPGANNTLPYNEGALKIKLFTMMLSNWQINFNNAGLDITDDAYTLQCLVRFMTVQEATFNAVQECKRSATTSPARCSPVCLGGGCVTFQQGHHGSRGSPVHVAGRSAGSGAGGNCPFHPGVHNWEMCFTNPHGPNYLPGFHPSMPGGAARGGCGNRTGGRGQQHHNQDVHFMENPVEEAEEHGYEEEPMLQNDMDTEAKGYGGEPSQEAQHWLENYNLDDQEWPKVIKQVEYLTGREDIFTNDSNEKNNDKDFIPMSFALAKAIHGHIHGQESSRNMLVLFDPRSTLIWISSNKLPERAKGDEAPPLIGMTIAWQFNSNKTVGLTNLCFPSFTEHDISRHTRQECSRHHVVTTWSSDATCFEQWVWLWTSRTT
jgi:hypothetical protein